MTIREVDFADVAHLATRAAREQVAIKRTQNTVWFADVNYAGQMVGVAALLQTKFGYRLKAAWVVPEARGQGIGTRLAEHRIAYAVEHCAAQIEALSLHPRFFLTRGFIADRVLSNGATRVQKRL